MRSLRAVLAAFVLVLASILWPPAARAIDGERMTEFSADYQLKADGSVDVTEHITYQFMGDSSHGIKRSVTTTQGYDQQQERHYTLGDVTATSPTGAPSDVDVQDGDPQTVIRIGNPDETVSGTQRYDLHYTLAHVVNAISSDNTVELNWNVLGQQTAVPVDKVTVTLTGPAASSKVACYKGEFGSTQTCTGTAGAKSTFAATGLQSYQGMTIVAAFPPSAFTDTSPDLSTIQQQSGNNPWGGSTGGDTGSSGASPIPRSVGIGGAVGLPVAAAGLMGLLVWKRGRDERYAGVTPGLTPQAGQDARVVRGGGGPVAVQFEPPADVRPGLMGTVIDGDAGTVDVSATIVDLAVRGYLRMEEVERSGMSIFGRADWKLTQLKQPDLDLLPYERRVFDALFMDGAVVLLSSLRNRFASTLRATQGLMYDEVVGRGWYRKSPQSTRQGFTVLGMLGLGGAFAVFSMSPLLAAGLALAGVIVIFMGRRMAARTAAGSAVLAQSLGFKKYLETAEASQFKFEEAERIFSRYMPYAVVFGLARKWAATFGEVAQAAEAAGRPMIMPMWYVPLGGGFGDFGSIADGVDDFGTTAAGTFTSTPGSATPGSSGMSGFSTGGGFSGGGGGGGGVSSW